MRAPFRAVFRWLLPKWGYDVLNGIRRHVLGVLLRGDRRQCPICGRSYRRFLSGGRKNEINEQLKVIGAGRREDMICPGCGSTDRSRHVFLCLQELGLIRSHMRLLHVAPEPELTATLRSLEDLDYVSGDLDPTVAMIELDVTEIEFDDATFDGVICNHVLEHVEQDKKAMMEIARVLTPGGWAILQVPISDDLEETFEDDSIQDEVDRSRLYGHYDHRRLYGPDYEERLREVGFTVEKFNYGREHSASESERYGLIPEEEIHVCIRQ